MGIVGRLDQYASMLAGEFDDYSMSENLLTYSEQFDNAAWTKTGCTITPNTTTSPYGLLSADTFLENSGVLSTHVIENSVTYEIGFSYRFTVFAKAYGSGNRLLYMSLYVGQNAAFDLVNGTVFSYSFVNGTTVKIEKYPNGWYRCSTISPVTVSASTYFASLYLATNSGVLTYTGDGASGVYIWGAQLERGSTTTDYTPTTTTAITRVLSSTTNTNITGLSTYFSSGFSENVGAATTLAANVFPPYDLVYDDFGGTLFGVGQGRYMRQNTDKSVIVYNEIDEVSDFYSRGVVRAGLVLDLDAGVPSSYPGTGTTWTDLSVYGNNGTLTNGPTFSSSNGGSIVFDGTNDVSIITSPTILQNQNFTISAWINPGVQNAAIISIIDFDHGASQGWVLQSEDATTNRNYYLAWYDGTQYQPVGGLGVGKGIQLTTSVWQNVTYTKNGTTLVGYLNGNQIYTPAAASNGNVSYITNRNLGIGDWILTGRAFKGNVSNTQIYNRALTAAEIKQNYDATKGRFGL